MSSAAATVLLLPVIIKHIGLDAYGLWAVVGIFITFSATLDLGIWKAVVYLVPRQTHEVDITVSSAVFLCCVTWAAFSATLIILLAAGVPLFGQAVASHGNLNWWLGVGGCLITLSCLLTNVVRGVLEGLFHGHAVNVGFAALTLLQYGIAALVSLEFADPRAFIACSASVYALVLFAHVGYLMHVRRVHFAIPRRAAMSSILRYGFGSLFADLPSNMLGPLVMYLLVLVASKGIDYGVFDIAFKIAWIAASALGMLATPLFAIVASARREGDHSVRQLVSRYLRVTIPLGVGGCLLYFAIGLDLLRRMFSDAKMIFDASMLMLLGTAFAAALEPVSRMEMGLGRLARLAMVRYAMLAATLIAIASLPSREPISRFSIALSIGFSVSAIGLIVLNRLESWGTTDTKLSVS
ncbi:MAG: hypothetical protein ACLPX1_04655 [Steroidobacteraceae bacterium]